MWIFAIQEKKIRKNRLNRIYPKGLPVLVIKKGAHLHAIASNCPHMGCSLGGALLEKNIITCPCHDWRFDITTGRFVEAHEIRLQTYESKIENGDVFIDIEEVNA
jgi:nitrite reductase/ring-hydroxylating ferredoxin subunit